MTRREAVRKALRFEPGESTPYHVDFTREMRARMRERLGREDVDEAVGNYMLPINVGSNAGAEVNRVAADLMAPIGPERFRDEFGVVWEKSGGDDIGLPANQVLTEPDADLLDMPDAADPRRWRGYEAVAATAGDRYVLACFSSPLFQRAWFLRGMAQLLMDMAANEGFVADLLDRLADFSAAVTREVARRGADGIFFYDDYAQQTGMMFSPAMFRKFLAPRLERLFGEARSAGLDVFFHSCGNVTAVLEDIRAAGAQVFNPLQPEAMDVAAVAERFRGRLAFYGGISTQKTLPCGSPEDVRREVRAIKKLFADSGGFILSPAHAVQRDVPLENVEAFFEAAKE